MPYTFEEFMKRTQNKGFTPDEYSIITEFGACFENSYHMMDTADTMAEFDAKLKGEKAPDKPEGYSAFMKKYKEATRNSFLDPIFTDSDDEKKKKWESDSGKLFGFLNYLLEDKNFRFFMEGAEKGGLNKEKYFRFIDLMNKKLDAGIDLNAHEKKYNEYEYYTKHKEEVLASEQKEKNEAKEKREKVKAEAESKKIKSEILKEWTEVEKPDDTENDELWIDLKEKSKGLDATHWHGGGRVSDELRELKEAVEDYRKYLENRYALDEDVSEMSFLIKIKEKASYYITKKRKDDEVTDEKERKPDSWEPWSDMGKERFRASKALLKFADRRMTAIIQNNAEEARAVDDDNIWKNDGFLLKNDEEPIEHTKPVEPERPKDEKVRGRSKSLHDPKRRVIGNENKAEEPAEVKPAEKVEDHEILSVVTRYSGKRFQARTRAEGEATDMAYDAADALSKLALPDKDLTPEDQNKAKEYIAQLVLNDMIADNKDLRKEVLNDYKNIKGYAKEIMKDNKFKDALPDTIDGNMLRSFLTGKNGFGIKNVRKAFNKDVKKDYNTVRLEETHAIKRTSSVSIKKK